ncbi:acyl carrier protein [Sphingomonas sp. HF-S3]|uniref:Acyl carrier protein n=1 Tax=Sphingomonas rustica TaxID=3103142 RepID=A0ABV0B951_9SPHN
MNREEVTGIVGEIMCDVFDLDELDYSDSLSAEDIEEWDSLSHISFVVAVEKRFGVRFTSAEIADLQTVGELVDKIVARV